MNLRRITDIHQLPVLDLETGEMLGEVVSWVVNPIQQKLVAFTLTKFGMWQKMKVVVPADVVEYAPKMIVVQSQTAVIVPDEIAGLAELLDSRTELTGFRAETETGKLLGVVSDFVFDVIGSTIQQYYIQPSTILGAIKSDLILPASRVIRIEKNRLVFPDDILTVMEPATQHQTQTI
jgi:uncharacterized protein YrrD